MNTHDNLITLHGEDAEVQRFLQFIFEDKLLSPGLVDLPRGRGFNRLNDLIDSDDRCVRCYERIQWDPELCRVCVETNGVSVGRLLVAASLKFKLLFHLETLDLDACPEEMFHSNKEAEWAAYEIENGRAFRVSAKKAG